jgi:hypothetical protein
MDLFLELGILRKPSNMLTSTPMADVSIIYRAGMGRL